MCLRFAGALVTRANANSLPHPLPSAQEVRRLAKPLGMTAVAVFGGSGIANQIGELKRGAEVVAATPGRFIDLLVTGGSCLLAQSAGRACRFDGLVDQQPYS